jgi:tetratricopeptide (TPR) repeat protein
MHWHFGSAGTRVAAWSRRHPGLLVVGLVLVTGLLGWACYRAHRYLAERAQLQTVREALDRHDWLEARKQLDACLRAWPDSPAVHLLAARAERRLQHLDLAAEHLDTCQRLQDGDTPATQVERALLRVQHGDLAGAEAFLRARVTEDDPDAVEILDVLAIGLIRDYRLPDAHRCLEEALRRQPDNFDLLVRHAQTARAQAWHTVAVESLTRALALLPESKAVRQLLIDNLLALGRYREALEQVELLEAQHPDDSGVLFARARCLAGLGQKAEALKLLDRLLARDANWPVLSERGWLCVELDRPEEAEPYLRRAHALAPPDQTLLTRLADCLRLVGKHDEARRFREQAERLHADTVRALQLTKRYREESANDADLCHELGCLLLRLGKAPDAVNFFKKALQVNPAHRRAHESLAAYYTQVGDVRQAAYHQRQLDQ